MDYAEDITQNDITRYYRQAAEQRSLAITTFKMAADERRLCWHRFLGMADLMFERTHTPEKQAFYDDFLDKEEGSILKLKQVMKTCKKAIRELDRILYEGTDSRSAN